GRFPWFVGQEPTQEGLDQLQKILKAHASPRRSSAPRAAHSPLCILAMPRGLSILGLEDRGEGPKGYRQPQPVLSEADEELTGRASMFYSALTALMIREPLLPSEPPIETGEMIEMALRASHALVVGNIQALKAPDPKVLFSYDTSLLSYRRGSSPEQGLASPLER